MNRTKFVFASATLVLSCLTLFSLYDASDSSTENLSAYKAPEYELEYEGAALAHIHIIGSGYGSESSKRMHSHLEKVGYDSVQLNTFAYMKDRRETEVVFGNDPTMTDSFLEQEIRNLHDAGFKVMIKTHVWVGGMKFDSDNWQGKIDFPDRKERKEWFSSYTSFILSQAELAEKNKVELLTIGTELVGLSKYTEDWRRLIRKVREVYNGKLTYAESGWNAKNVKFWDSLDYIGMDIYFTLTERKNPEVGELVEGWEEYEGEMEELSEEYGKKIIFTEIGYKSSEGAATKPWEWEADHAGGVSQREQANVYKATHLVFRDKPYLSGIFVWKYFTEMDSYERPNIEKGFTPYGKEAEKVISEWFKK